MTLLLALAVPAALVAGYLAGATSAARRACYFKHDWTDAGTRVEPRATARTVRCTRCGATRTRRYPKRPPHT